MRSTRLLVALVPVVSLLNACGGGDGNSPAPQSYTVGGSSSGVSGTGLTLQLNSGQDLAVSANGTFNFPTALAAGSTYSVTIKSQPVSPPQTCVLTNATGSVSNANVANVSIACTTNSYLVGGTVTGLNGTGLVLQNNGGGDLTPTSSGSFAFTGKVSFGAAYAVTVKSQPLNPSQTCTVASGSGTVASADISNVAVSCTTNAYAIGGSASGLAGTGFVISLNGTVNLPLSANGSFTFPDQLASGTAYAVTVQTQPVGPHQTCSVTAGTGIVTSTAIGNVAINCTTNTYLTGGSIGGLAGSGLALTLNGSFDLPISANGTFTFQNPLPSGTPYAVTVKTQPTTPHQTCVASNASGIITGSPIGSIAVNCTTNSYAVGGLISGLTGSGLVLQLSGNQDLSVAANGTFAFPVPVPSGTQYTVTVKNPSSTFRELCVASNATGTVAGSAINSVIVDCETVEGFVYVVNGASNKLFSYGIRPQSGTLLPFESTASAPGSARVMLAAPNGKNLYISDYSTNSVTTLAVDSSHGTLTSLGSVPAGAQATGAWSMTIAPSGKFLYAASDVASDIIRFSIDSITGALSGATVVASNPGVIRSVPSITPDGAFLYLLTRPASGTTAPTLTTYSVDATTGALTSIASTMMTVGISDIVIHPAGHTLYLRRFQMPVLDTQETVMLPYSIDAGTGALTPVGIGTTVLSNGAEFVIEPSGQYAYLLDNLNAPVVTPNKNHVDAFSIDPSTGALTVIGSPTRIHSAPRGLAVSSGGFLFVSSNNYEFGQPSSTWYDVLGFAIGTAGPGTGQLTPAGVGTPYVGSNISQNALIAVIE